MDYALQRLNSTTRYLTPNSRKLLTLYKDACFDLHLELDDLLPAEKKEHIDALQGYEANISTTYFLKDVSAPELLQELVKLRRHAFLARYGDYARHIVAQLRKGAAAAQPPTQYADKLSGQFLWSDISNSIKEESTTWQSQGSLQVDLVPVTFAIYHNCKVAGIQNFDNMISLIHLYADRNVAFHWGIQEDLEAQRYSVIAQCIFEDLRDLSSVCTPAMADTETALRALLEQMRDDWFETCDAPDQPQGWDNKPAIKEQYKQLKKGKKVKEGTLRLVAQRAATRLSYDQENEDLVVQAATETPNPSYQLPPPGPGAPTSSSKGKSKAPKKAVRREA